MNEEFTLLFQDEVTLILPQPKRLQLEAQAAKRGVEPDALVERALERVQKDRAFAASTFSRALEICRVRYSEHQNDRHLWPKSLSKSVVVGIFLNAIEDRKCREAGKVIRTRPTLPGPFRAAVLRQIRDIRCRNSTQLFSTHSPGSKTLADESRE
jgi:hypothetical protein